MLSSIRRVDQTCQETYIQASRKKIVPQLEPSAIATLSYEDCQAIERREGSPFYLLDVNEFVRNYTTFQQAFEQQYRPVRLGYSYKTNYAPQLCRLVKDLGGYAEVVSRLEYELALRIGQRPDQIIFNGPVKTRDDIALGFANGSTINVDSHAELELVLAEAERSPNLRPRIGLRVNSCLRDAHGASHVQEGLAQSRFGFPAPVLGEVGERLRRANLPVHALHGHTSSSSRETWIYEHITATLCRLAREHFAETVEEINVGGGFYGPMPPELAPPNAPTFDDYAEAIGRVMRASPWVRSKRPTLVLEPGVAIVANAMSFVTRVLEIKEFGDKVLAVADGNVFHTRPSMHTKRQPFGVIRAANTHAAERLLSVTGSTCMEKDYLLTDVTCALAPGDYLRIDNVGAYTIVMSPTFIHPAPAIVIPDAGGFRTARRRQSLEQVFAAYEW